PGQGTIPAPVAIPGLREAGHHQAEPRRSAGWTYQAQRACRLAAVVLRAYLFSDRLQEPSAGNGELGLELRHVPARGAADHRYRWRPDERGEAGGRLQE